MDYYLKGTKISLTTPRVALDKIKNYDFSRSSYISIFGLYPLMHSFENKELQNALNAAYINPIHGKTIEFFLKAKKIKNISTVDGVFLLKQLLNEPLKHFFYGANKETLDKIREKINIQYPNAIISGFKQPPMIDINDIKDNQQLKKDFLEINEAHPDIVWIGLGGIKQDLVMYYYHRHLDKSLLIGVGAVFDYFAENLSLSSERVKKYGFRWLYRLVRQPKLIKKKLELIKMLASLPFKTNIK